MDENLEYRILFLGDITGRPGRLAVSSYIKNLTDNNKPDFIFANIENASHGFGLTKKNYEELSAIGIDCFTSGNHIWDKKDIYEYISEADKLIRPINYPKGTPGVGYKIVEKENLKIGVINVLGRVFMPPIDSPWEIVIDTIDNMIKDNVKNILIDFHGEATAEKLCFARFLSEKYNNENLSVVKAFCGTHTHVQTADEKITNGMAYITDAGFCGSTEGIIGMEYLTSLKRLSTSLPERYEISGGNLAQINGVEIVINKQFATQIKRINFMIDNNENIKEAKIDSGG